MAINQNIVDIKNVNEWQDISFSERLISVSWLPRGDVFLRKRGGYQAVKLRLGAVVNVGGYKWEVLSSGGAQLFAYQSADNEIVGENPVISMPALVFGGAVDIILSAGSSYFIESDRDLKAVWIQNGYDSAGRLELGGLGAGMELAAGDRVRLECAGNVNIVATNAASCILKINFERWSER